MTKRRSSKTAALREDSPEYRTNGNAARDKLKFIDLFCGIGGFRKRRTVEFAQFPTDGPKLETILDAEVPDQSTLTDHLWS